MARRSTAVCRWCGKRAGWLSPLTENGLCPECENVIAADLVQRVRIIEDCVRLVEEGKKLETRLGRLDLLLEHARALLEYEQRGIPTIETPPSVLIEQYATRHDELIVDTLQGEVESAFMKSDTATTVRTKLTPLTKTLTNVREYKSQVNDPRALFELEAQLMTRINLTQLRDYLDKARRAEFKGQRKKALDQYYEALYFLKSDEIDDSFQAEYISEIEGKIVELGGELPSDAVSLQIAAQARDELDIQLRPGADSDRWTVHRASDNTEYGPYSRAAIAEYAAQGLFQTTDTAHNPGGERVAVDDLIAPPPEPPASENATA